MSWSEKQIDLICNHVRSNWSLPVSIQSELIFIMKSDKFHSLCDNIIPIIFCIYPINDEKLRIVKELKKDLNYFSIEISHGIWYFIFRNEEDMNFAKLLLNGNRLSDGLIPILDFKKLLEKLDVCNVQ